jgi:uncharacterized coiled-coil protein SlyX
MAGLEKMGDKIGFGRVSSTSADEQNMEQIREILFGEQNRQTATRIGHMETRLGEQEAALRELLEQRIEKAMAALRQEIETRNGEQRAAIDGLDSALRKILDKTDERLSLLDSDLQDSGHRLGESIKQHTEALNRLEQGQVDRSQLAELFESVARQLRT